MPTTPGRTACRSLALLAIVVTPLTVVTRTASTATGTNLICQTCDPPDPPPSPRPSPTPTPRPSFTTLMSRYTPYDINADGIREINSLKPLFPNPEPYRVAANGVVIVLVDPKLVTDEPTLQMTRFEMSTWLGILGNDISADGFFPYFVEASVYSGPVHQDGRTVLALRRFLKEVRSYYPLAGVLLVGSFPDAAIVRSVLVKATSYADEPLDLTSGSEPITGYVGHHLSLKADYVTPRAEIVLGDLDGNWESLYKPTFSVTDYEALPYEPSGSYPLDGQVIETSRFSLRTNWFQDAFFIQDHQVTATASGAGSLTLSIASLDEPSPEATAADRQRPNRIARPEILVSRIDPLRVAIMPTAPPDLDGKSPLDASGRPQKLRYDNPYNAPPYISWRRDRNLERKLVADYIARSHRFRLGSDDWLPFRTSAVRSDDLLLTSPADFNKLLRRASGSFQPSTAADDATLFDYVNWLKQPAVLRGIAAHSSEVDSLFGPVSNPVALELATGGYDLATGAHVWRWVARRRDGEWLLEPSFEGIQARANFHIYRTMWESGILDDAGAGQTFIVHDGCNVMRPLNAESVPYDSPSYGQGDPTGTVSNGESLMFYGNGLGLMARNKIFNDTPSGYYEAIKSTGGRFGYGWRGYFLTDAGNPDLDERALDPTVVKPGSDRRDRTLQRKRSYFWNTIGDFTLKIRY